MNGRRPYGDDPSARIVLNEFNYPLTHGRLSWQLVCVPTTARYAVTIAYQCKRQWTPAATDA